MQDAPKAVWSIPCVSAACFPSLKQNFIVYCSSKVSSCPDCIFEIHQLWQSGFSRVYSNSCCSCSFEPEIIKIGQSSHKMYSNNILNFQESTTIPNTCTKKSGNLLNAPRIYTNRSTWSMTGSKGFYEHQRVRQKVRREKWAKNKKCVPICIGKIFKYSWSKEELKSFLFFCCYFWITVKSSINRLIFNYWIISFNQWKTKTKFFLINVYDNSNAQWHLFSKL